MIRTNQHLTTRQLEELDQMSLDRDLPRAELVRRAIDEFLAKHKRKEAKEQQKS